jgi:hypothetical protein
MDLRIAAVRGVSILGFCQIILPAPTLLAPKLLATWKFGRHLPPRQNQLTPTA